MVNFYRTYCSKSGWLPRADNYQLPNEL